ncbi:Whole genome shotgun sequence [Vibrio owensii]|uniref:Whole genome shotgun sequence n=1 Tax=Vibrio owensii TaxID=696485 RepID=A0AAU9PYM2_9VIBR|nr:Whole genome shotgun sequence [Vibrio owensii]
MKKGEIKKESIPIEEVVTISAPIQVVIRKGEFTVKELIIAGKPVQCFQGLTNTLLEKQREFLKNQKAKTPHDW